MEKEGQEILKVVEVRKQMTMQADDVAASTRLLVWLGLLCMTKLRNDSYLESYELRTAYQCLSESVDAANRRWKLDTCYGGRKVKRVPARVRGMQLLHQDRYFRSALPPLLALGAMRGEYSRTGSRGRTCQ